MSIRPELLGKKFPSKSGIRPMTRERFISRVTFRDKVNKSTKKGGESIGAENDNRYIIQRIGQRAGS
jgi:hypothetical protein